MIRYLAHSITKCKNIETGYECYELSHWYTSDESPQIAGNRLNGLFNSYKEAEDHHNKLLVDGLIKNEI